MTTLKQLEANRRNALKSTGPRTESGKIVSRMNALKTGIDAEAQVLPGESPEAFAALSAQYYDFYCPVTPEQQIQLDIVITCEWLLRRLRRVEHNIWDAEFQIIAGNPRTDQERPFGETYKRQDQILHRLQHRINSTHRHLQAALRVLRQLQAADPPAAPPEPIPLQLVTPPIGFVPPVGLPPAPAALKRERLPYHLHKETSCASSFPC